MEAQEQEEVHMEEQRPEKPHTEAQEPEEPHTEEQLPEEPHTENRPQEGRRMEAQPVEGQRGETLEIPQITEGLPEQSEGPQLQHRVHRLERRVLPRRFWTKSSGAKEEL